MKRRAVCLGILVLGLVCAGSALGAERSDGLQMYTGTVDRATVGELARDGYDVAAATEVAGGGVRIDLVLSGSDRARLAGRGIRLALKRNKHGFTSQELAAQQSAFGFNVWRSWDEPRGIRDELYEIADQHPSLTKLEVVGHSIQGRAIVALKVTKNARRIPDGRRPAVLYSSNQHAREWISLEVNRRLLHYFLDNYGSDPEVTKLVNTRELWFVLSANPDGYQYTFTGDRLWRKNLHDNDGDGTITSIDGVDPNRNFDEHWRYDDEGSSSQFPSETFRGESLASEPETVAMQQLLLRIEPAFQVNFHSFGNLLLYSFGWQVQTPSADDPIFVALSGTDDNPAIPGFDPGVGADLYTTNGETTDYAHARAKTLAWTPELGEGVAGNGFVFPDDEALIEAEFQKTLAFDLDVAKSAPDPARPESHLGLTTKPFYLDVSEIDPQKRNNPLSDMRFSVSYGDPQPVQVLARRSLGAVSLRYQINGGRIYSAPTSEWDGGDRFGGPGDVYYRYLRGTVTGTQPGDVVKVWFVDANRRNVQSESFSYTAKVESRNRVLVLAAEDYSGISPAYANATGPTYLAYYLDALQANGVSADIYDVDANGRLAPDDLGVLSHYDAVIWYTGDDIVTRNVGMLPGTASRLANDELLNVRSYLNEGGRLLYTGKYAGFQYAFGYEFDPINGAACDPASDADGCFPLGDDFLQYYLGAYLYNDDAGTTAEGTIYDVLGVDTPFQGLNWTFGDPSANNQDHSASFIATSGILPAAIYPQFTSWASAKYDRPGGPFEPHTGEYYMYSGIADVSYKRLTHTVDLTASTSGNLSFWISRNTEQDWDHVFVEAHTVGQDDWTTLPDLNGHTSTATGESCAAGWRDLHPWLDHYQTWDGAETCTSTGTTGVWNAATGSSSGWEQWSVDLSAYAGKQVEISIAYVSDWSSQGLGVFVDDIVTSTGDDGTTSFEAGLDGWAVTGPPPGSAPNANNWTRTTAAGFPEGAAITTGPPDADYRTIYLGFGLEGIATPDARNAVMGRALDYLLE